MNTPVFLSKAEARKIILNASGLARKAQFGTGIEAVYRVIDHLGFLQLDTNYTVERAHHQMLFARVPDYQPEWLAELCEDGRIFEYFLSDSGFIPMHDFRYSIPVKKGFAAGRSLLTPAESRLMKEILDRVERDGAVMVSDFTADRIEASSGWWDWRPAKVAIERLYLDGTLMITRNKAFRKLYDLPLNLMPLDVDVTEPTSEEFSRYIIFRTLAALGIASFKDMAWRARRVKGNPLKAELAKMVEEGQVSVVNVEGLKKNEFYMLSDQEGNVEISGDVFILSPFDTLTVFRHRLTEFFNFDYQIECFVPAEKRIYGYFSLPVLLGDVFIARMDSKADRKHKILIIHNLHFEPVVLDQKEIAKLAEALKAFVTFNQCLDISFQKSNNNDYLEKLKSGF